MGETLRFTDHNGKAHHLEFGPTQTHEDGYATVYINVDHHQRNYRMVPERARESKTEQALSAGEIDTLARSGDVRSPFKANVFEVSVAVGDTIAPGDTLVVLEAMKMQTAVVSEIKGVVDTIFVSAGDTVTQGDKLAIILEQEA